METHIRERRDVFRLLDMSWGRLNKPAIKHTVWIGRAPDQINWHVWPRDCWLTSGSAYSCVLDSLTVVFFTVFLHRDLHFALGSFAVRFTIWGIEERRGGSWKIFKCTFKTCEFHQTTPQLNELYTQSLASHSSCLPRVSKMLSECHCETD